MIEQTQNAPTEKSLADYFHELSDFVEDKVFPRFVNPLFDTKSIEENRKIQKTIYYLSHPLSSIPLINIYIYLFASILIVANFYLFMIGLILALQIKTDSFPKVLTFSAIDYWYIAGFIVLLSITIVIIVAWWNNFFQVRKENLRWKAAITITIIFLLYSGINELLLIGDSFSDLTSLHQYIFLGSIGLVILPSSLYLIVISLDFLTDLLFPIPNSIRNLWKIFRPRSINTIKELSDTDVEISEEWTIGALSLSELQFLKEYSHSNRESNEKNLIPVTLLLTIFAILSTFNIFNIQIEQLFNAYIQNALTILTFKISSLGTLLSYFGSIFIFILPIVFLGVFIKSLLSIFRNMHVQGLIIEACLNVENEKKKQELSKSSDHRIDLRSWINSLLLALTYFLESMWKKKD